MFHYRTFDVSEVSFMNIAQLRKAAKMKQADLAEAMGVNRSTIAKWESGISAPKSAALPKLANVLGCSIEKLYESKEVAV